MSQTEKDKYLHGISDMWNLKKKPKIAKGENKMVAPRGWGNGRDAV